MREELISLLERLEKETGLPRRRIIEVLVSALKVAAERKFGQKNIKVEFDEEKGEFLIFVNNKRLSTQQLGRIVAFRARQIIAQKIREEEKSLLAEKFAKRKGEIVWGIVDRREGRDYILEVEGMEVRLPYRETLPQDEFYRGEKVKALVLEVDKNAEYPVLLSRTHPQFLEKLLLEEVPELKEGTVKIKNVVREPGYRSKVAVESSRKEIDSIGALIGIKGTRIKPVLHELRGEKIDIIPYSDDIKEFIARALAPAEVEEIEIYPENKRARVIVKDDQLSLAIGKKGQNVSLAARLTGWNIDVRPVSQALREKKISEEEKIKEFTSLPGIDEDKAKKLIQAGFFTLEDICRVPRDELEKLLEINTEEAQKIVKMAREMLKKEGVKIG